MKKQHMIISGILVVIIFFFSLFIFSSIFKENVYELESKGLLFVSDSLHPTQFFGIASATQSFVVSPQFAETGSTSFMTESLALFNSVLISNDKKVETVARVVGPDKSLLYCQVNDGNVLSNRRIESAECMQRLDSTQKIVFFVELPDDSLSRSKVEVFSNKVIVRAKNFAEVSPASFVLLESIFPNAAQVVEGVNVVIGHIGNN